MKPICAHSAHCVLSESESDYLILELTYLLIKINPTPDYLSATCAQCAKLHRTPRLRLFDAVTNERTTTMSVGRFPNRHVFRYELHRPETVAAESRHTTIDGRKVNYFHPLSECGKFTQRRVITLCADRTPIGTIHKSGESHWMPDRAIMPNPKPTSQRKAIEQTVRAHFAGTVTAQ